jgi:predicted RNA-binding protein with PIN domain
MTAFTVKHGPPGRKPKLRGRRNRRAGPTAGGFEPLRAGATDSLGAMRWIIDGMNVIGTRPDGWWRDRHAAMVKLVDLLERWAAADGEDVMVVFEQPPRPPIVSSVIEVAYAKRPRANSADDEIVRRVRAADDPASVRVVTSDGVLSQQVHAAGASTFPSSTFRSQIDG